MSISLILTVLFRKELCNEDYREFFYMCPLCSDTCDFWYYRSGCAVASITLLFDNGGTVFFALFMALWGMWQNTLQYHNKIIISSFSITHVCT